MSNKGKVALTGANGFIGSHLAEYLAEKGYAVHCIVRPTSNLKWIKDKGYLFHECGLTDVDALAKAFEGSKYIFHLAGVVAALNYNDYLYGNVTLTENVLKAALEMKMPPSKIVVTSSLAVGGPSTIDSPVTEADGFNPMVLYGKAKEEQEKLCERYFDKLNITIARPSVIAGEREVELFEFIKAVNSGVVPLVGRKDKYACVVDIHDLVKGLYDMAKEHNTAGEAYYMGSEEFITWRELAEIIAAKLGKKPVYLKLPHSVIKVAGGLSGFVGKLRGKAPTFDGEKAKEGTQGAWICDSSKAKKDFGFEQTRTIKESIENAIDWYKKEGWL